MYQKLKFDVTLIDTGLMGETIVACYLIESEGECAIIETGNFKTTQRILDLLDQRNIDISKVRYVIPTHVHLDHAGGASGLIDALPKAQLIIHPKGARHMIDPTKLIVGATAVYGEQFFKEMYGKIKPIPEHRVIIAEDGDKLSFGNRTLEFRDTPGHANHHFCIWDKQSKGWFTGDTFGIGYPGLTVNNKPFVFPTTSPVQFNPESLIKSINLLMSYKPDIMYLTHFGAIKVTQQHSESLCQQINDYVDIISGLSEQERTDDNVIPILKKYYLDAIVAHGCKLDVEEISRIIDLDIKLNSQGLVVWNNRRAN